MSSSEKIALKNDEGECKSGMCRNTFGLFSLPRAHSDDLEYSPDFFEYFRATHRLLRTDSSLWCISAWNDNGKSSLVSEEAGECCMTIVADGDVDSVCQRE